MRRVTFSVRASLWTTLVSSVSYNTASTAVVWSRSRTLPPYHPATLPP